MLCPSGVANVNEDYFDESNEFDSLFHLTIYRAAGNTLITDILLNSLDEVQWLKTTSGTSHDRIKSRFMELERILKALEARDSKTAAALMREHIGNAASFAAEVRSCQSLVKVNSAPPRRKSKSASPRLDLSSRRRIEHAGGSPKTRRRFAAAGATPTRC